MEYAISIATENDAFALAALRNRVAEHMTTEFGPGHWSSATTEGAMRRVISSSRVLMAHDASGVIATLRLSTTRPWSINPDFFTRVSSPLYLIDMAVSPQRQRLGIGRRLLDSAKEAARAWPGDAIRLDAYEGPAGAGPFYAKCGWSEVRRATYRRVPLIYFEWLV